MWPFPLYYHCCHTHGYYKNLTWVNSLNKYHEFDVTAFVQAQAAGDNIVSLQLQMTANQDKQVNLFSKENTTVVNGVVPKPQLLIYH